MVGVSLLGGGDEHVYGDDSVGSGNRNHPLLPPNQCLDTSRTILKAFLRHLLRFRDTPKVV